MIEFRLLVIAIRYHVARWLFAKARAIAPKVDEKTAAHLPGIGADLDLVPTRDLFLELADRYDTSAFIGIRRGHGGLCDVRMLSKNVADRVAFLDRVSEMFREGGCKIKESGF